MYSRLLALTFISVQPVKHVHVYCSGCSYEQPTWEKMFIVHFGDMREELRNYVSKPVAKWQQNLTVRSK